MATADRSSPLARPGAFVAIALVAALIRTPVALLHGRLWAEEGTVFARDLAGASFAQALGYVYNGTIQLLTSVPVWAAFHLSVATAPLLLTWFALGIQLVFAGQFGRWAHDAGLAPPVAALALFGLLVQPVFFEISATATNIQWILSLSMLVLLLTSGAALGGRLGRLSVWTALSGLTGVPAAMLAPAFLLRAWAERSRAHAVLGTILSAAAALQAALILTHPLPGRELAVHPLVIGTSIAAHTVWASLVGLPIRVVSGLVAHPGAVGLLVGLALIAGAGVIIAGLAWLAVRAGTSRLLVGLLVACWLGVSALNLFGAIGPQVEALRPPADGRYFAFGIVASIMLVLPVTRGGELAARGARVFLAWFAVLGLAQIAFGQFKRPYVAGPSWEEGLARCRVAPNRPCPVPIWPTAPAGAPPWIATLPPGTVPAAPPSDR